VALVGLSGVGKSTLGRALAAALGWPLADTDDLIVRGQGRPVDAIFAGLGEAHFRDLEAAALAAALSGPPLVLSTGGGAVLRADSRALLRRHALTVWLDAPDAVVLDRLAAHAERRPLLADNPAARLAALRAARAEIYRSVADLTIDTAATPTAAALAQIIAALGVHRTDEL
jgi:shikimate kinase